jgi:glutamate dehydrogenase
MTDEVAELVLRNNYRQTLALSMAETTAKGDLDSHSRFMRMLERNGVLDRGVEYLPDEEAIRELKDAGQGLSRPEIAVLIAYSKNTLFEELLASDFADDSYLERDLFAYFPNRLGESYGEAVRQHQLRREIISTKVANEIVNMGGLTFLSRIREHTGSDTPDAARSFVASRDVFDLVALRRRINDLDLAVDAETQIGMQLDLANFLRRQVLWFLRYYPDGSEIGDLVDRYRDPIREISTRIEDMISEFEADYLQRRIKARVDKGVPVDLARDICALDPLSSACDIADIARQFDWPVEEAARAYSEMGGLVGLPQLRASAARLTAGEHFERLSVKRMIEDLFRQQRFLTLGAIQHADASGRGNLSGADAVDIWAQAHAGPVDRATALIQEMDSHGAMTAAKLALAASQVRDLALGIGGATPGQG